MDIGGALPRPIFARTRPSLPERCPPIEGLPPWKSPPSQSAPGRSAASFQLVQSYGAALPHTIPSFCFSNTLPFHASPKPFGQQSLAQAACAGSPLEARGLKLGGQTHPKKGIVFREPLLPRLQTGAQKARLHRQTGCQGCRGMGGGLRASAPLHPWSQGARD